MNRNIDINKMEYGSSAYGSSGYAGAIAISETCPSTLRYSGDTIHMQATPQNGISPYIVEFRKTDSLIAGCRYTGVGQNETLYCDYTLTDSDIASAITGQIKFSVYVTDSCPTSTQTCEQSCYINIGCIAPVCNFTVS